MIKPFIIFLVYGVVLAILQGILGIYFPEFTSKIYIVSHFVLFMLTLFAIFSVSVIAKLTKVLPAFIFLGQSLVKVIFGGSFFIFALRFLQKEGKPSFMIFFISLYFIYMIIELILVINSLKKES